MPLAPPLYYVTFMISPKHSRLQIYSIRLPYHIRPLHSHTYISETILILIKINIILDNIILSNLKFHFIIVRCFDYKLNRGILISAVSNVGTAPHPHPVSILINHFQNGYFTQLKLWRESHSILNIVRHAHSVAQNIPFNPAFRIKKRPFFLKKNS